MRICKTLGEDSHGFIRLWERICKDSQDFGRIFTRICETLGEDSQGFQDSGRVFTKIHIGKGFMRICKDFLRLWESIHKDSWGFARIHKDS